MRWYKIEFYDYDPLATKMRIDPCFALQHRITYVERQYSTPNRAKAAADKIMRRYPNCVGYYIRVL